MALGGIARDNGSPQLVGNHFGSIAVEGNHKDVATYRYQATFI